MGWVCCISSLSLSTSLRSIYVWISSLLFPVIVSSPRSHTCIAYYQHFYILHPSGTAEDTDSGYLAPIRIQRKCFQVPTLVGKTGDGGEDPEQKKLGVIHPARAIQSAIKCGPAIISRSSSLPSSLPLSLLLDRGTLQRIDLRMRARMLRDERRLY